MKKLEKKAIKDIKLAKKKLMAAENKIIKYAKKHPAKAASIAGSITAAIGGIAAGTYYLVKKKR